MYKNEDDIDSFIKYKEVILKLLLIHGLGNKFLIDFLKKFLIYNQNIDTNSQPIYINNKNLDIKIPKEKIQSLNDIFNLSVSDHLKLGIPLNYSNLIKQNKAKVLEKYNKIVDYSNKYNIKIISYWDNEYPLRLRHIFNPPLILFYKGNYNLNSEKILSIVGSRDTSYYGLNFIKNLISKLKNTGISIVSGMAIGTDINSHNEALKNSIPTIAVLPCGIDVICPSKHTFISKEIEMNGLIISEFPPFSKILKYNFPIRNRIIAGISDASIIIEAAEKSGALITANYAFEYDRGVFALPGDINRKTSVGCNQLIKNQKAEILIDHRQILDFFKLDKSPNQQNKSPNITKKNISHNLTTSEKKLYEFILNKNKEVNIEELYQKSNEFENFEFLLMNLQMKGIIIEAPGNKIRIV